MNQSSAPARVRPSEPVLDPAGCDDNSPCSNAVDLLPLPSETVYDLDQPTGVAAALLNHAAVLDDFRLIRQGGRRTVRGYLGLQATHLKTQSRAAVDKALRRITADESYRRNAHGGEIVAEAASLLARPETLDDCDGVVAGRLRALHDRLHQWAAVWSSLALPPAVGDIKLTDRQQAILGELLAQGATSLETRRSTVEIARGVDGRKARTNTFKTPISQLVTLGLLCSKPGRSGGMWLSSAGIPVAQAAQSPAKR